MDKPNAPATGLRSGQCGKERAGSTQRLCLSLAARKCSISKAVTVAIFVRSEKQH